MNIITDKMAFGGNCIGKIDGKTVFVPYAIPGEELEIEITESHKDYDLAEIKKVLKPSEFRIQSPCPYYQKCGGCNLLHIVPEKQVEYRLQILSDLLKNNHVDFEASQIEVISGSSYYYRARLQLNDGGFSKKSSNEIIKIENCKMLEPVLNEWLKNNETRPSGRCHVFGSNRIIGEEKVKVAVETKRNENDSSFSKKNKNYKKIKKHYEGSFISEENTLSIEILGKKIKFDVRGFFQSNMDVLEKSIKAVLNGLVGNKVLDMYSGCGTFSVFLSDYFENVTLVEHNRDALVFAEENLLNKNHQSFGLSGAKWVQINNETFDAVVIDPPRTGIEKEVMDYLCESHIPQIRSVSCNPSTHARDISILLKNGYKLEKLYLLDFYPNTSHIESLAYLSYDK